MVVVGPNPAAESDDAGRQCDSLLLLLLLLMVAEDDDGGESVDDGHCCLDLDKKVRVGEKTAADSDGGGIFGAAAGEDYDGLWSVVVRLRRLIPVQPPSYCF